ncbi:hypothetical protein [Streptomyces sp. NPDC048349]|uniref:hypothetical protein n=1 Tax=Streptomyces sp. NPDC048349 TaxID=3155486 RepID=UPI00341432C4
MTMTQSRGRTSLPTPAELRRQIAHARVELGRIVDMLAAKADAAERPHGRTAAVTAQAARVAGRVRDTAVHVGRLVEDKTPTPVRAHLASARGAAGRSGTTARTRRTAWTGVAGAVAFALLARRSRRARRARLQK